MRTRKGRKVYYSKFLAEAYNKIMSRMVEREEICNNNAIKSLETFTLADTEELSKTMKNTVENEIMLNLMIERSLGRRC